MTARLDATPADLLGAARDLTRRSDPATAGLWPRAAALLARQALESAMDSFWRSKSAGMVAVTTHAQLTCLPEYLEDVAAAQSLSHTWKLLTLACHHYTYEIAPAASEVRMWLDDADRALRALSL